MVAGVYIHFIRVPEISTVFYPEQMNQIPGQNALIDPQPPQRQNTVVKHTPEPEDEKQLIQRLEQERETITQKADALREIVESTPAPETTETDQKTVLPENEELRKLQQEKDSEEQKKLDEIEALNAQRLADEKKIPEQPENEQKTFLPIERKGPKNAKNENKKNIPVKKETPVIVQNSNLPSPDLIQTNFMASLPDFSQIKKDNVANAVPLHIIDPLPELLEESRYGNLPVEKKGKTPFSAYRKTQENPPETPYVAILFSGLGKRDNATQAAINALPDVVSLSFSPYTDKLKNYVTDARKVGHETLLDLPMQQGAFPDADPGPLGLISGLPEQENRKRLRRVLGQDVAFIGLSATPNETFSYSGTQMKPFLDEIVRRGLIYIDGTDDPKMPVYANALRPDIYIADGFYRSAIRLRLEQAKKTALEKGSAFIRVEAMPITLLTVAEWMKTFVPTEQVPVPEISFVPLSYYIAQKKEKK